MSLQEIDFSKTLNDEQVFETIMGTIQILVKIGLFINGIG